VEKEGMIPPHGRDWNQIADDMMKFVLESYLSISTDIAERSNLRQLLAKRTTQPYKGKSGPHQCYVHLQTMGRIGLLQFEEGKREFCDMPETGVTQSRLTKFLRALPDVLALERLWERGNWEAAAFSTYYSDELGSPKLDGVSLLEAFRRIYAVIMATGVSMCSIKSLIESVQIEELAVGSSPPSRNMCMEVLKKAASDNPTKVRFHVDRLGRPAFILLA
jgi:hypothetical protein